MSYEGREYFILKDGRLLTTDAYDFEIPKEAEWWASVDHTNGYYEDDPGTHEPHTKIVGFIDHWKEDHYGNKYALKENLYEPINGMGLNEWRKVE